MPQRPVPAVPVQTPTSRRILWIKADPLFPPDSGGRIRTFEMLRRWHVRHRITYLALLSPETPAAAAEHARSYSSEQAWIPWRAWPRRGIGLLAALLRNLIFSRLPFVIDKYRSTAAAVEIARLDRAHGFDLIIADFLSMTPNLVASGIAADRIVVFQHNVESQIWRRHVDAAGNPLVRAYLTVQWQRYRRFEGRMCARFRGVITVSEADSARLRSEFGLTNVLGEVPTGVDVDYFGGVGRAPEPCHLVFVGSMDWLPNIDGVVGFVGSVLPAIRRRCPAVRLTILGRNPSPAVVALQDIEAGILVTGTVDDVRPWMSRAALSVVPQRIGGGTRIKIFESMAMGIPVVSSTIGAEGLPVTDGVDIAIADGPDAFAQRVVALLEDAALAESIGLAGRRLVAERYSWDAAVAAFDRLCDVAIETG